MARFLGPPLSPDVTYLDRKRSQALASNALHSDDERNPNLICEIWKALRQLLPLIACVKA